MKKEMNGVQLVIAIGFVVAAIVSLQERQYIVALASASLCLLTALTSAPAPPTPPAPPAPSAPPAPPSLRRTPALITPTHLAPPGRAVGVPVSTAARGLRVVPASPAVGVRTIDPLEAAGAGAVLGGGLVGLGTYLLGGDDDSPPPLTSEGPDPTITNYYNFTSQQPQFDSSFPNSHLQLPITHFFPQTNSRILIGR